jgi:alcohol dehydrogenase
MLKYLEYLKGDDSMNFSFFNPTKVFFGIDCISNYDNHFLDIGKKALIVTGKSSAKKTGAYNDIISVLKKYNIDHVLFDDVSENPNFEIIERAKDFGIKNNVDFIIGIGGGSPMDAAKALAVLIANPDFDVEDLYNNNFDKALKIVEITTTSGTGSEVTQYSVLTDMDNNKRGFGNFKTFPYISFVDPKYTLELNFDLTLTTAVDAMSHSIEGLISNTSTDLTDLFAKKSLELIKNTLPIILSSESNLNDLSLRNDLSLASMYAGMVISQTGTVLPHVLGYGLTSNYGIRHGVATALFQLPVIRKINSENPQKLDTLYDVFYSFEDFNNFINDLNLDRYCTKLKSEDIDSFTKNALNSKHIKKTPATFTYDDIFSFYSEVCK